MSLRQVKILSKRYLDIDDPDAGDPPNSTLLPQLEKDAKTLPGAQGTRQTVEVSRQLTTRAPTLHLDVLILENHLDRLRLLAGTHKKTLQLAQVANLGRQRQNLGHEGRGKKLLELVGLAHRHQGPFALFLLEGRLQLPDLAPDSTFCASSPLVPKPKRHRRRKDNQQTRGFPHMCTSTLLQILPAATKKDLVIFAPTEMSATSNPRPVPQRAPSFGRALVALSSLTIWATLTVLATLPLDAAELNGQLTLLEKGKSIPKENRTAVIWFNPRAPVKTTPLAEPLEMTTVRKEFLPKVLAVPVGTRVRFPNQDPILHNVFSVSGENRFDLGLYKQGEAKEAQFQQPGIVNVFCNVHHSMVAYLVVLDTPYFAQPTPEGRFTLTGLPAGPGVLTLWQERAEPKRIELTLPLTAPLQVELELTKPRVPPHRNKFGQPYERDRGKAY